MRSATSTAAAVVVVGALAATARAFAVPPPSTVRSTSRLNVAAPPPVEEKALASDAIAASRVAPADDARDFLLSEDQVMPLFKFNADTPREKVVNAFGLWCLAASLLTGPVWMAAMMIVDKVVGDADPTKSLFDATGKVWSKVWLSLTGSYPEISGAENLLPEGRACLYVANHASWLDIPVLCTALDPVFKFIAKGELAKVPCIGTQLKGGDHIMIDRDDRRSQLTAFKSGIKWLRNGVPIMAFPEGQRSKDGRLLPEFKGGLFVMAAKLGVPIVPITISHAHAVMPANSLFPVQSGRGKLSVRIGAAITDTSGKTEAELAAVVRAEFMNALPVQQRTLPSEMAAES